VELAYAWRFLPPADAERRTDALIRLARAAGVVQLDAGARYLPAFGVPHGALAFAERLLHEPGFERSASIARVLALVGLGRPDTAVALARRLAGRFPDLAIFADELSAAMLVFDSDSARFAVELPAVRARLNGDVDQPGPADRRRRGGEAGRAARTPGPWCPVGVRLRRGRNAGRAAAALRRGPGRAGLGRPPLGGRGGTAGAAFPDPRVLLTAGRRSGSPLGGTL